MPLTGKDVKDICGCMCIIKRPKLPPASSSAALHRPIPPTSSWLPLYLKKYSCLNTCTPAAESAVPSASTSDYYGDVEVESSAPDLSSVYASPRFFFSSPGLSNSILDSASYTSAEEEEEVVVAESPDPYSDFRRSMEEMVEARALHNVPDNWESLKELLRRYLSLNPEPNHKFIAGAFADLLVSLMSSPRNSSDGGISAGAPLPPLLNIID